MRLLTTLLIAFLLAGCASIFPPKYDTNQFQLLVRLSVRADHAIQLCEKGAIRAQFETMDIYTDELVTMSKYLPDNAETHEIAQILDKDIDEIIKRYETAEAGINWPSPAYCKGKMKIFKKKVDRTLEAIGKTQ